MGLALTNQHALSNTVRALILMIIIMFVLTQLSMGSSRLPGISKVLAVDRSIVLAGTSTGWNSTTAINNPTITVSQGDFVTMRLSGADLAGHLFFVDVDKNRIDDCSALDKCSSDFRFPYDTVYLFTVDFPVGNYSYHCKYHVLMTGSFIVQTPVSDFTVTSDKSSISSVGPGMEASSALAITPVNGFNGQVTLSASTSSPALTATITPTMIGDGSGSSKLTISSSNPGNYSVSVTATSGGLSHSLTIPVTIGDGDFSLTVNPNGQNITLGMSATFRLTAQSLNGFSGNIAITSSVTPSSPSVSVIPSSLHLSPGGSGTSTVMVTTTLGSGPHNSPTLTGAYTLTLTGTSGIVNSSAKAVINVSAQASSINIPSTSSANKNTMNPILLEAGIVAAAVIVIIAGGTILLRRRK